MNDQVAGHPLPGLLGDFARGLLEEEAAGVIEDHLAACRRCVELLESSQKSDGFVDLVRAAGRSTVAVAPIPPRPEPPPSGYELLEPLGRGGMGVVYLARQRSLGRLVALKQVRAGLDADAEELARFRLEAEASARLNHPHIVRVFDVGAQDGLPYLAMELVTGGTLADRIASGRLDVRWSARLLSMLARAIEHAHQAGVVHRDLKPSNVLMTVEGSPKVGDFGLAKEMEADADRTRTGALLGTPGYMAPEQASGGEVGPLTDVHALGVLLYECLTGRPPYRGATLVDTLDLVRHGEPEAPRRVCRSVPRELETICLKAMAKEPGRRYESAGALADDLDRYLDGRPISARATSVWERARKWACRRPAEAVATGLVGLLVVGTFTGLLAHQARLSTEVDRARRATEEAQAQRKLADANYRAARAAVQGVLGGLNDPRFESFARRSELSQVQTEAALEFYDQLLKSELPPDHEARLDAAHAAFEAGNLQTLVGRLDAASASFGRALELFEELIARSPGDATLKRHRAATLVKLGFATPGDQIDTVIARFERARVELEAIARGSAATIDDESDLAWCLQALGATLIRANRAAEAEPLIERALALHRGLAAKLPNDARRGLMVASDLSNLGLNAMGRGDSGRADSLFDEAARCLTPLMGSGPGGAIASATYAELSVNRGNLEAGQGRSDEALKRYEEGLRAIEGPLANEPSQPRLRLAARQIYGARAVLLEGLGRHHDAVSDWRHALSLNDLANETSFLQLSLALCLVRAGDYQTGLDQLEPLLAGASSPTDAYNFACVLALSSAAAQWDESITVEERNTRSQDLADRSISWLQRASQGGLFHDEGMAKHARSDPDLAAVHSRAEFASIVGELTPAPAADGP